MFKAKVVRLGGSPLERAIRDAEQRLRDARRTRDRVRGQLRALNEELERREASVAAAEVALAELKNDIN